jgi:Ger(x)C family germination protein
MQQTWAVILVLLMLLSSGCGTMTDVERTAVGAGLGVDLDNENNVLFYAQFNRPVNVQETGANEAQSEVFTGRGKTPTQAARNITLVMPHLPLWSHADIFVLGEKLARTDLYYMADFLSRNRNIRKNSFLVVAYKVSPYDIFHGECPFALCSSRGIINILRAQDKNFGVYPLVTSLEFVTKLLSYGIDPVAPQVTIVKKDGRSILTIDGMAVFRQNRMVGSLNELECRGYRWLSPTSKKDGLVVLSAPWPGVDYISLEVNEFNTRTRPRFADGKLIMDVQVDVIVGLVDIGGMVNILENERIIEDLAAQEIERQIYACIAKAQQLNSDILGWGQKVQRYEPEVWETLKPLWYDTYPHIEAQVAVKADLRGQRLLVNPLLNRR